MVENRDYPVNLAFYGHAHTAILTATVDGKYVDHAMPSGMKLIHQLISSAHNIGSANYELDDTGDNDFRRDYFGLHRYKNSEKGGFFSVSRYLGCREGTIPHNIYSIPPENPDLPTDLLFVWDEGYGGLSLPENSRYVFWASDKSLPDREQFEKVAANCLLILSADVLRDAGAMISRQISWERTASELIKQIQSNPSINYLLDARFLFIPFDFDGALFLISGNKKLESSLVLTHGGGEGTIRGKYQGDVTEAFTMMTALIGVKADLLLRFLEIENSSVVTYGSALREALELGEGLFSTGFVLNEGNTGLSFNVTEVNRRGWEAFPIPLERKSDNSLYVPEDWTVTSNVGNKKIYDVAFDYVVEGAKIIEGLPQLSLGALTTVDRWEIEAYQNIRNLILSFASGDATRPLSIAVFGAPGAGKSFGVTQIAKNVLPGKVEKLEFNVSQFISHTDLGAAFQKVRDVILEGKLPLVFFDEFDSDKDGVQLGWLKSFLMPMQDGRFRDESGEHPLGKCILVFAGGTSSSFEKFAAPMTSENRDVRNTFKSIKGPDFISRLKGTINVLGPNPKDANDKNHILRRALLLRSLCERKLNMKDGKAPVSPGIINAMLLIPEFRHGARSMEAILDMSRIDSGVWDPASLPFYSQLSLHVDADTFLRLTEQIT